ncbi:EscU/YscU/HrcU family type III secretion system export apparatus switch protein [Martelella alba]|uniref:EscU/YscU/HrcU family type III secretion system export apparatus switch protein n=1 Tax=Martelella alba TaxID=2590451 RepID=A0A506U6Z5_9HYPH|nr:EscU/YscU/HrcU family type III secretion system export apparatus switch protein [Martelella alba]TPW28844.1 EscU/YscU/HrcU family type III secretion system export apparatus switch protein [Martelella alba]
MSGEKTEQPTEQKLRKLRQEGQVPSRKNVGEFALLTFTTFLIIALMPNMIAALMELTKSVINDVATNAEQPGIATYDAIFRVIYLTLSICGASAAFTLFATLLLNRFNFSMKPLEPKFSKFNPMSKLKSIFGKSNLYTFIRMLIYFSAVSYLTYAIIRYNINNALQASYCDLQCEAPLMIALLKWLIYAILALLLVLAAIDYLIQSKLFISQNKMSKDDVKREYKDQEGNPEIKAERNSIARSDADAPTIGQATHIVYSDSHLVAVIYYRNANMKPYVVAKYSGPQVQTLVRQLKPTRLQLFNLPSVAYDFFRMGRLSQYMPAPSMKGMEKILEIEDKRNAAAEQNSNPG